MITPRQVEIIEWLGWGKTAWEIGQILNISENTVHAHLSNALKRTRTHSQAQLIVWCYDEGFLKPKVRAVSSGT